MTEHLLHLEPPRNLLQPLAALDRGARALVRSRLSSIGDGALTLLDADGAETFGDAGNGPKATIAVHDPSVYRALSLRGALGGAESYMDGDWQTDDLTSVVRVLARNRSALEGIDNGVARLARPGLALYHALRRNSRTGSRRNIAAHYDLGNEFFELFLDPTLAYSSGIFESPQASMEQASVAKFDRVCRKLRLRPEDHVLEIGTGWGGFALHAARHYGCRVTTTTISRRQLECARERVCEAGLGDRVEVLFDDYRDLSGRYDKLVSIEMIEAVGHTHLPSFFRVVGERLASNGAALIQAITVPDAQYQRHIRSIDFIKRYIFPGGELVSVAAMNEAVAAETGLRMTHLEEITPHYAETLRHWRRKLFQNLPQVRALGLDDRFLRMWEFYLCYCEAGFEEREIGVVQALFEGRGSRRAPVLGHID